MIISPHSVSALVWLLRSVNISHLVQVLQLSNALSFSMWREDVDWVSLGVEARWSSPEAFRVCPNQWRALYKPSEKPGCMWQSSMHIRHQERTRNKNYSWEREVESGHETIRQWILVKWKTDPDLVLERQLNLLDGITMPTMTGVWLKYWHTKDQGWLAQRWSHTAQPFDGENGAQRTTHIHTHTFTPANSSSLSRCQTHLFLS